MASFQSDIETTLIGEGAALVGFADMRELAADIRHSLDSAISIAVALDPSIIRDIADGPTVGYFHEYHRANELLSHLCTVAVDLLEKHGRRTVGIEPTISKLDKKSLMTPLPHKTAATRAGHGWVGKSALVVTKDYGTAVRFATVLSDGVFETGSPIDDSRCGECFDCVDRCPANAIKGNHWKAGVKRELIYDARACYDMAKRLSAEIGVQATICGICIAACPHTKRYVNRVSDN